MKNFYTSKDTINDMKINCKLKEFSTRHIVDKGLVFRTCKNSPTYQFLTTTKRQILQYKKQIETKREGYLMEGQKSIPFQPEATFNN